MRGETNERVRDDRRASSTRRLQIHQTERLRRRRVPPLALGRVRLTHDILERLSPRLFSRRRRRVNLFLQRQFPPA